METANRNASGAGVEMSKVDGMPLDRRCSDRLRGARILAVYSSDALALVVELNLNPEVSKPTIKLILSRSNVQPMAHAAHSLFRRCGHLDQSGFLPQVSTIATKYATVAVGGSLPWKP
jgi:hypothetical protein